MDMRQVGFFDKVEEALVQKRLMDVKRTETGPTVLEQKEREIRAAVGKIFAAAKGPEVS